MAVRYVFFPALFMLMSATQSLAESYVSPEYGWEISSPEGWDLSRVDSGQVAIRPPPALSELLDPAGWTVVGVHTNAVRFSELSETTDFLLDYRRELFAAQGLGYEVLRRESCRMEGQLACERVVDRIGGTHGLVSMILFVQRGQVAVSVVAETRAEYWPFWQDAFEAILASFHW